MNSRERVLCALKKEIPDAVPYMYNCMDQDLQERIIQKKIEINTVNSINSWGFTGRPGENTKVDPALTVCTEVVDSLKLDAIGIQILPPLFVNAEVREGRAEIKDGLLVTREALNKVKMPDPDDEKLYAKLKEMIKQIKGDRAVYARIRLGASPTLLSMGVEGFSYALCDEPELVNDVLNMYCTWSSRVTKNLCELDFDFFWCFDDIAFKTAPMFSLNILEEYFIPNMKIAAAAIKKPWVFHSDGNLVSMLPQLITLGMDGLHPLEPGAMDLDFLKAEYGKKLCLIGNIDIDRTLSRGTVDDVYREVKERILQLAPGGGYIISDSNSVPSYCKPENVIAMARAVEEYRYIYKDNSCN
jgi:uroporphyrinogen decarboxylase